MAALARVGVVGAGQMGLGIAYVACKTAKAQVLLADHSEAALSKGLSFFDALLEKDVKKSKLTSSEANEARQRLVPAKRGIEDFGDVELAIEAASESLALKKTLFAQLAQHCPSSAVLGSNTSSISISKIAASALPAELAKKGLSAGDSEVTAYTSRVIGLHFFNPVPVMSLVELIPSLQTSEDTVSRARGYAEQMGKTVVLAPDGPGFISNRLLMPFLNESITLLETTSATAEAIDTTFKLGMAHPMGPLRLADFIGLDTCLAIQQNLAEETGDSKYRPSVLLARMVDAGYLGKKSGKGFYEY